MFDCKPWETAMEIWFNCLYFILSYFYFYHDKHKMETILQLFSTSSCFSAISNDNKKGKRDFAIY